jgi:hypothetical protein
MYSVKIGHSFELEEIIVEIEADLGATLIVERTRYTQGKVVEFQLNHFEADERAEKVEQ